MTSTRIEAENYTIASDTTPGNSGVPYPENNPNSGDADIYTTSDASGYMLSGIRPGEWLEYDLSLPQTGTYNIVARVVSPKRFNHSIDLSIGGQTYTFEFSRTGSSWESWTDIVLSNVPLNGGDQSIRLVMGSSKFSLNYIEFIPTNASPSPVPAPVPTPTPTPNPPSPSPSPSPTPPSPSPSPTPGSVIRVEAEDYTAYRDTTSGNAGGEYRTDDVDIYTTTDASGYTVAGIKAGEWLEQSVTIPESGAYTLVARVASPKSLAHNLTVTIGGQNHQFSFGKTGSSWEAWANITIPDVDLVAGSQTLRMTMGSSKFSLNYVDIIPAGSESPTPAPAPSPNPTPAPSPNPTPTPTPLFDLGRVMPLGDSITDGFSTFRGGYRDRLENLLTDNEIAFDFVGGLRNGPSSLSDRDHEGHSGFRLDEIADSATSWVQAQDPDVVLLLGGTNDMNQNFQVNTAPDRLSDLIDQILAAAPQSHVVVSTIPPTNKNQVQPRVEAYNAAIPGVVAEKIAAGQSVSLVDNFSVLTTADLGDNLHPNQGGYNKMAQVWFDELLGLVQSSPSSAALPTMTAAIPLASTAGSTSNQQESLASSLLGNGPATMTSASSLGSSVSPFPDSSLIEQEPSEVIGGSLNPDGLLG